MNDSMIMLRRNFKQTFRNPISVFNAVLFPIVLLLLFVYVLGGAFDVGGGDYIDYAAPGMLLMGVTYGLSATATAVNADTTKGINNRFRVMGISRGAVLNGHVVATLMRNLISVGAILGVSLLIGFRPGAGFTDWLGVIGLTALLGFAASWLTIAMGLAAKTAESAGLATVPLIMLPFLSSAIVPADTMAPGFRQFAEYQPFTPIIETLRGLLNGTPSSGDAIAAVAWCVGIAVIGYIWARTKFSRRV